MARDPHDARGGVPATDQIASILSELDEADFRRFDPPDELWAAIEAEITTQPTPSDGERASLATAAGTIVEYSIDADDVVVAVGRNWADFARANDAPELVTLPPHRTLWSYFDSDEITDVWRLLVERVRAKQQETEVPLRCDAPHARRWLRMSIAPAPDGAVRFRCELVFEEVRPPVALLDIDTQRDTDLQPVPLCSWCARVQDGDRWVTIEQFVQTARLLELPSLPPIAHGICATCRDQMSAELLVPDHRESSA
jgi:hypothetical protein